MLDGFYLNHPLVVGDPRTPRVSARAIRRIKTTVCSMDITPDAVQSIACAPTLRACVLTIELLLDRYMHGMQRMSRLIRLFSEAVLLYRFTRMLCNSGQGETAAVCGTMLQRRLTVALIELPNVRHANIIALGECRHMHGADNWTGVCAGAAAAALTIRAFSGLANISILLANEHDDLNGVDLFVLNGAGRLAVSVKSFGDGESRMELVRLSKGQQRRHPGKELRSILRGARVAEETYGHTFLPAYVRICRSKAAPLNTEPSHREIRQARALIRAIPH